MQINVSHTRAVGLEQLEAFVARAGAEYARGRNFDRGTGPACTVSRLSPFLQRRLLSEAEVLTKVHARHGAHAGEKYLQEVLWRTYWKGWLEQHPGVWCAWRQEVAQQGQLGRALQDAITRAENGATGIACFDAWAQQLTQTGLLHNHARMWFASIWTFTLKLPWALGADFFYRHLLDGDPASNTLSWRWVAGLQTRGKFYLAGANNIAHYTDGAFPSTPGLATAAAPPADRADVSAVPAYLPELPTSPPSGRLGLLVTPEDLTPELDAPAAYPFVAAAILAPDWLRAAHHLAEPTLAVGREAVADAQTRVGAHYGLSVAHLDVADASGQVGLPCAAAVLAWAQRERLQALVLARPFVGPWWDLLAPLLEEETGDLRIVDYRRHHDRIWFPHASRGFFQLKKQMPVLLGRLS